MTKAFPVIEMDKAETGWLPKSIIEVSDDFSFPFENAGCMMDGMLYTAKVTEKEEPPVPLKNILEPNADKSFYIPEEKMVRWTYLKGAKKIPRKSADGHVYTFSEGAVAFPDSLESPGRTILTSEGTINRSSHVIKDLKTGKLRTLTPIEAERLQGFDDNWTNTGMSKRMRFFCMGNALVVPMVTRMGSVLDEIFEKEK